MYSIGTHRQVTCNEQKKTWSNQAHHDVAMHLDKIAKSFAQMPFDNTHREFLGPLSSYVKVDNTAGYIASQVTLHEVACHDNRV